MTSATTAPITTAGFPNTDADNVVEYYRETFDWPVVADATRVSLRIGEHVDALVIRARLAKSVDQILVRCLLSAPIAEVPRPGRVWIFLTQPRIPLRQSTWDDLARLKVFSPQPGSLMPLPPVGAVTDRVRWLRRPVQGAVLPPWSAVVGAVRSAANRL